MELDFYAIPENRKFYHPDHEFLEIHFRSRWVKETIFVGQLKEETKCTIFLLQIDPKTREQTTCCIPKKFIISRKQISVPSENDVGTWLAEKKGEANG